MRPVSAAFLEAIRTSHSSVARAELLVPGGATTPLPVDEGTVTLDAAASIRGRLDITFIDEDGTLVPRKASDLLAPYGNEVRAYRGVRYPSGAVELVSLGVFRIERTSVPGDGRIACEAQDRSSIIRDARFEEPYEVPAGKNVATAIRDTLRPAYPRVDTSRFAETTATTPTLVAEDGDDRWDFCTSMALAAGMRLYFDGDGLAALTPEASGSTVDVQLVEGENGVLLEAAREWDREGAYNRVIASSSNVNVDPPVRGVETDENPNSPTYYHGSFGRVPRFYSSPFLRTVDQARSAARAILLRSLGTTQNVDFGTVVHPALEPGDVARITRQAVGVDENHIIDQIVIPLGPLAASTGRTRAVQITPTQ